ncbi:MAG: L-carnitine dehydrogenase [Gammaproteobacteria bacterium]|nr:L-carnitine dehydrogenase [Gammaproteobacteria bacterium]
MEIKNVTVVGTGVIGAGWTARCLAHGLDVVAWDPAPGAEKALRASVENAWPAVTKLGLYPRASMDRLRFATSLEDACAGADFIQENAPEREDLKRKIHAQIDEVTRADVLIASSTSGLLPSSFQSDCKHPERVIVGHPFNPVYLLPLVEVLRGDKTSERSSERAMEFYKSIGMYPLKVRKEIAGFLSDRLQEALWREVLHLVNDDVATTEELDAAISYGPGLRWSIWGTCLIFHLAGGEGGMRHMLQHFDPSMFPWTKLEPPKITEELIDKMAAGTEQQAAGRSIKELEQLRDNCLISVMQALQEYKVGAGEVLAANEKRRRELTS